jgi:FKBP-type peptidyl-prolyl cis-trans isomerase
MQRYRISFLSFLAIVLAAAAPCILAQNTAGGTDLVHVVAGTVQHIDRATKTVVVKTADGAEQTYHYTDKTTVHAAKAVGHDTRDASVDTAHGFRDGSHVLVHYTGQGTDKTANGFDDFGKTSVKDAHGTIVHVDNAAHTMTVKTQDGTLQTFHMTKDATLDTGHGVEKLSDATGKDVKQGSTVTVHYTEMAGQKVAHLFEAF